MSGTEITNSNIGESVKYNGKRCKVVSSSAAYITIVSDGKEIPVRKDSLLFDYASNIVDSNNKRIEKYRADAQKYEQQKALAKENEKGILDKMRYLCNEWGVSFLHQMDSSQKDEYKGLKKDFYSARFDAIAAGNKSYSAHCSIFDLTLDNAKYMV